MYNLLIGTIIHSIQFGQLEIISHGGLVYSPETGIIHQILDFTQNPNQLLQIKAQQQQSSPQYHEIIDHTGKLILPGFIDAHCHAPQYIFTGTGMDLPLLQWLEKYTFPSEAKFSNETYARFAYEKSIKRHLKCGTTFASYFATIHLNACQILVDVIQKCGQRAFVGKVSMDRNSPDFYIENTKEGYETAEIFVKYVLEQTKQGKEFLKAIEESSLTSSSCIPLSPTEKNVLFGDIEEEGEDAEDISVKFVSPAISEPSSAKVSSSFFPAFKKVRREVTDDYSAAIPSSGHNGGGVLAFNAPLPTRLRAVTMDYPEGKEELETISYSSSSSDMKMMIPSMDSSSSDVIYQQQKQNHQSKKRIRDEKSELIANNSSNNNNLTLLNRHDTPLVLPCITPRFVPTCTAEIMSKLGEIAKKYNLPIQSHLSESKNEIKWVLDLHPECDSYAGVYERYGLLSNVTYMAHCCHSSKEERDILRKSGSSVVHCASSNFMLHSGVMDVRLFLSEGVKVALGTDVAGGFSPSMLDAMRQTMIASRVKGIDHHHARTLKEEAEMKNTAAQIILNNDSDNSSISSASNHSEEQSEEEEAEESNLPEEIYKPLNYMEAFHLATVGGAEVLGMDKVVGNFLPGKKLDCLIIDVNVENSPIDVFDHETTEELFQKFLFLGDDRNIVHVYVDGKMVL